MRTDDIKPQPAQADEDQDKTPAPATGIISEVDLHELENGYQELTRQRQQMVDELSRLDLRIARQEGAILYLRDRLGQGQNGQQ